MIYSSILSLCNGIISSILMLQNFPKDPKEQEKNGVFFHTYIYLHSKRMYIKVIKGVNYVEWSLGVFIYKYVWVEFYRDAFNSFSNDIYYEDVQKGSCRVNHTVIINCLVKVTLYSIYTIKTWPANKHMQVTLIKLLSKHLGVRQNSDIVI